MSLESAEAFRDQLHDLPAGFTQREQVEIDALAADLCAQHFDELDKESLRDEYIEAHWQDHVPAAIDQLGLL